MPNRIKHDYGFRELLNSDDPGIRNYMVRNISFMISFCNKREIVNEQVVFLKKLLNEVSREEKNANFAHKVEDLPDDRWLGGYRPSDHELFVDEVEGFEEPVSKGYTPTLKDAYVFPPHRPEIVEMKPKEKPLDLMKRMLSKFVKERLNKFDESKDINDLTFKRADLQTWIKGKRDPENSAYSEQDLQPNGILYTKLSTLIENKADTKKLAKIATGNKYTYVINYERWSMID